MCSAFWVVAVLVSAYYGARGVVIQTRLIGDENATRRDRGLPEWTRWQRIFVHYIQDLVFNAACSLAGFAALSLEWDLLRSPEMSQISTGSSIVAVFLAFVAITGVSGKLPELIHRGKVLPTGGSAAG